MTNVVEVPFWAIAVGVPLAVMGATELVRMLVDQYRMESRDRDDIRTGM